MSCQIRPCRIVGRWGEEGRRSRQEARRGLTGRRTFSREMIAVWVGRVIWIGVHRERGVKLSCEVEKSLLPPPPSLWQRGRIPLSGCTNDRTRSQIEPAKAHEHKSPILATAPSLTLLLMPSIQPALGLASLVAAAFQVLQMFGKLSWSLPEWYVHMADIFNVLSMPIGVEPVCTTWYEEISRGEFYFM